jgi:hypothetical protein
MNPIKTLGELIFSGRISSSCSTRGIRKSPFFSLGPVEFWRGQLFKNFTGPKVQLIFFLKSTPVERTFYRCFLPSFSSFGWGVSEEKIKMWKVNKWQTTDAKWWRKLTLPLARWVKNVYSDRPTLMLFLFVSTIGIISVLTLSTSPPAQDQ